MLEKSEKKGQYGLNVCRHTNGVATQYTTFVYEKVLWHTLPNGVGFISVCFLIFVKYVLERLMSFVFILNYDEPQFQGKVLQFFIECGICNAVK
jgi:hypothetical protein